MCSRSAALAATVVAFWAPTASATPPDDRVRRELERLFARPEFNPPANDFWMEVWRWLAQLFGWLGRLSGDNRPMFWIILLGCIALLALLLAHIVWTLYRALYAEVGRATHDSLANERLRLSARFRGEADENARRGDFTAAIRCLFLSLVHYFDESGRLLFRPALTNREYLRHFSERPPLYDQLHILVNLLDVNWYGERPSEGADYAHCLQLYDDLRRQR